MYLCAIAMAHTQRVAVRKRNYPAPKGKRRPVWQTREYERTRERLLEEMVPGEPCFLCHRPMNRGERLDVHHVVPVAVGGGAGPLVLTHAPCNRSFQHGRPLRANPAKRGPLHIDPCGGFTGRGSSRWSPNRGRGGRGTGDGSHPSTDKRFVEVLGAFARFSEHP